MHISDLRNISLEVKSVIDMMPDFVKSASKIEIFSRNSFIIEKYSLADSVYIFCSGEIEVINQFENGRTYVFRHSAALNTCYDGIPDFLGSIAVVANKETFITTVVAFKKCITIKLPRETFMKWMFSDFSFAMKIAKLIAIQHYESSHLHGYTTAYSVKYLLVNYLLDSYYENQREGPYTLKESRKKISESLCTTERTLNRAVNFLLSNDYIEISKGKIVISPANLKKLSLLVEQLKE